MDAHDSIIESQVIQKYYADQQRSKEPELKVNSLVYLSTWNLSLPKGRPSKLLPKFIGPYPIVEVHSDTSNYKLSLPTELAKHGIYNKFHVSLL